MILNSTITDEIVTALQSISDVVLMMNNDPSLISAYHYFYADEKQLAKTVWSMQAPSILVVWDGDVGGNFDGMTIVKHKFLVYMRVASAANLTDPKSYEYLWWAMLNKPILGGSVNIRYYNDLVSGLDLMDTPSIMHRIDESKRDYFVGSFVFPEKGDT